MAKYRRVAKRSFKRSTLRKKRSSFRKRKAVRSRGRPRGRRTGRSTLSRNNTTGQTYTCTEIVDLVDFESSPAAQSYHMSINPKNFTRFYAVAQSFDSFKIKKCKFTIIPQQTPSYTQNFQVQGFAPHFISWDETMGSIYDSDINSWAKAAGAPHAKHHSIYKEWSRSIIPKVRVEETIAQHLTTMSTWVNPWMSISEIDNDYVYNSIGFWMPGMTSAHNKVFLTSAPALPFSTTDTDKCHWTIVKTVTFMLRGKRNKTGLKNDPICEIKTL